MFNYIEIKKLWYIIAPTMKSFLSVLLMTFFLNQSYAQFPISSEKPNQTTAVAREGGVGSSGGGEGTESRLYYIIEKLRDHFKNDSSFSRYPEMNKMCTLWNGEKLKCKDAFLNLLIFKGVVFKLSDKQLYDQWGNPRDAIYFKHTNEIQIYENGFWGLSGSAQFLLIFHELLGLIGLENEPKDLRSTYPISPRLELNILKVINEDLIDFKQYEEGTILLKFSCKASSQSHYLNGKWNFKKANLFLALSHLKEEDLKVRPSDFKNWQISDLEEYKSVYNLLQKKRLMSHFTVGGSYSFFDKKVQKNLPIQFGHSVVMNEENDPTNILMSSSDLRLLSINVMDDRGNVIWEKSNQAEFKLNLNAALDSIENEEAYISGSVLFSELIPHKPRSKGNTQVMGGFEIAPKNSEMIPLYCRPEVSEWDEKNNIEKEIGSQDQLKIMREIMQLFSKLNKSRYTIPKIDHIFLYEFENKLKNVKPTFKDF